MVFGLLPPLIEAFVEMLIIVAHLPGIEGRGVADLKTVAKRGTCSERVLSFSYTPKSFGNICRTSQERLDGAKDGSYILLGNCILKFSLSNKNAIALKFYLFLKQSQ